MPPENEADVGDSPKCRNVASPSTLVVWASLASWSVLDPSLTHTTTVPARNFGGPVGAIISDLLFQTLGFAAVVALIAPFVWSIELLRTEQVAGGRSKLGFYPISILTFAGAISALPVFDGWPLRHGSDCRSCPSGPSSLAGRSCKAARPA